MPIPDHADCEECVQLPPEVLRTLTKSNGRFELPAKSGHDLALVVQKGQFLRISSLDVAKGEASVATAISTLPGAWAPDMTAQATQPGFYRRPLPEPAIAFASEAGRRLFASALADGTLDGYFALAEQFHTQSEPAYCGLGTLVVVLNALQIDPGRLWKGPWRWFGEDLLDCCAPLKSIQETGITADRLVCLARCNGATAQLHRASEGSLEEFRRNVVSACSQADAPHLVASYARADLGQTGGGHFSPLAGYHRQSDRVLILDVARFKYPPHWVPIDRLWQAMLAEDAQTGKSRGWIVLGRDPRAPGLLPALRRMTGGAQGLRWNYPSLVTRRLRALTLAQPNYGFDELVAELSGPLIESQHGHDRTCARPPPEQLAGEIHELLTNLRSTAMYRQVAPAMHSGLADAELVALILLSRPPSLLGVLPGGLADTITTMAQGDQLSDGLENDVQWLRHQWHELAEWADAGTPV